jgi:hypothetical protein
MSRHHDHDHHHDHQHGHDHHHGHGDAPLSFSEKLVKLLDHWIQHNDHHAEDYRKWAKDARENGQVEVADLLVSAAELTGSISERLREAGGKVHPDEKG